MLVGISNAEDQETGQPEMCVWMGEVGSPPLDRFGLFLWQYQPGQCVL